MKRIVHIFLLVTSLLLAGTASADPYDVFGAGARAIAMSGAFTGLADDGSAAFYNPAGLAQIPRLQIEAGYFYADPQLRINGRDNGVDQNKGTYISVAASIKILGHRLTTGVNFFFPDQHVLRFLMLPNSNPRFSLYYNDNHTIAVYVCSGLEVFNWLYIGAGINYIGGNEGGVDFRISEREPSTGSLKSDITSMITPLFGVMFVPHRTVRIGATYREEVQVELYLPNRIEIPEITVFDENPIPILEKTVLTLLTTAYSHFSPRQIALGVSWRITDRVLVSVDCTWNQWSRMRNPAPYTTLELVGGLGDLFPTTPTVEIGDPNLHDNFVPAIGTEAIPLTSRYVDLLLRAGYSYRPTPISEQRNVMNFVDTDTHIISAGLGLTFKNFMRVLPRPFSIDFFFQAHVLEPRRYVKDRLWDPVGDYEVGGEVYSAGAVLTLRF